MVVQVDQAAAWIAAVAAGTAGLAYLLRGAWRLTQVIHRLAEDLLGEPARPGQPARPGVIARLDDLDGRMRRVEAQVNPNGGSSLHDKVTAVKRAVEQQQT